MRRFKHLFSIPFYNPFRGVETYFRILNGKINKGEQVQFMATKKNYSADEIGALKA